MSIWLFDAILELFLETGCWAVRRSIYRVYDSFKTSLDLGEGMVLVAQESQPDGVAVVE